MDPVKIAIFLAVFVVLLAIGRMLSASSEVHAAQMPRPEPQKGNAGATSSSENDNPEQPVLTGAEISFPIQLPPVTRLADGHFNRPNVLNYYFAKTDLVRGPADPSSFCDEFYIELQDPDSEHVWTDDYTVATPVGLQQVMSSDKFDSLYLAGNTVVVSRWDLAVILQTVMEETMKMYGREEAKAEGHPSGKALRSP